MTGEKSAKISPYRKYDTL